MHIETYQALFSRELVGERKFKEMRGMDGHKPSRNRIESMGEGL